jgi:glucose-6-phosphate isomerase
MSFKQHIDKCLDSTIGANGISVSDIEKYEKIIASNIDKLAASKFKLFDFSDIEAKVLEIENLVKNLLVNNKHLYILGTGGATLCGQTICGLCDNEILKSKITFVDNIDPKSFEFIKNNINPSESVILVNSKSGGTLETITQFAFFAEIYEETIGEDKIKDHFLVVTDADSENNIIGNIANKLSIKIIPHEKVGGRFSIFSAVGLIPASFVGLDIKSFLNGAKSELEKTFIAKKSYAVTGAAIHNAFVDIKKINATVMMPYIDRLKNYTTWYAQIWSESLGKNDIATTPIRSLGTLDQHSQLQLYLGGKKDKFFNVMYVKDAKNDFKIKLNHYFSDENLDYINNKTFSQVMNSAALATIETLAKNKSPVRVFEIDVLDEFTHGAICMHSILETVLQGLAWELNPFDQPAVEQGKHLTIKMLKSI